MWSLVIDVFQIIQFLNSLLVFRIVKKPKALFKYHVHKNKHSYNPFSCLYVCVCVIWTDMKIKSILFLIFELHKNFWLTGETRKKESVVYSNVVKIMPFIPILLLTFCNFCLWEWKKFVTSNYSQRYHVHVRTIH